jgi:hypothetical protein
MKKAIVTVIAAVLVLFAGCKSGRFEDYVTFVSVDPLEKVFRESSYFVPSGSSAEAGIGEYATFQFALRSSVPLKKVKIKVSEPQNGKFKLPIERKGLVKYVHVSRAIPNPSNDRLTPISGYYPDPITDLDQFDLKPDETQPIWITVKVPAGTSPGDYAGHVKVIARVAGKKLFINRQIKVTVYPVDLTQTSLKITNWFFTDRLDLCNNGKAVVPFSDRYWELVQILATTMASYRQNVGWIDPLSLTVCTKTEGEWSFDFGDFNHMARILLGTGTMNLLEGVHLASRESDWTSRFLMHLPVNRDSVTSLPVSDSLVSEFYSSFLPALKKDLEINGWDKLYIQHIADEPIAENIESYKEISSFIKGIWPEVKIIEACHSNDLAGSIDIWVPELDFLEKDIDFYQSRQNNREVVWFYTCLAPQGEYANRFIEMPLIKTRLLHWINYRYNVTGYLHWGFNHWSNDPWNETTGIITESGNILPGGDSWIVYPGYGKIFPSIRLEAMRDGIADYELLKKYGDIFPERAAEMARQVVYNFQRYDTDIESFREKRHRMLNELSSN